MDEFRPYCMAAVTEFVGGRSEEAFRNRPSCRLRDVP